MRIPKISIDDEKYGIGELKGMGYDGVVLPDEGRTNYVVFYPKSISAKPAEGLNEIIAYHGSNSVFDKFDLNLAGSVNDPGDYGEGIYFDTDIDWARAYKRGENGQLVTANINLSNPFIINFTEYSNYRTLKSKGEVDRYSTHPELQKYVDALISGGAGINMESIKEKSHGDVTFLTISRSLGAKNITKYLKNAGYDGVIVNYGKTKEIVVFDPEKINIVDIQKEALNERLFREYVRKVLEENENINETYETDNQIIDFANDVIQYLAYGNYEFLKIEGKDYGFIRGLELSAAYPEEKYSDIGDFIKNTYIWVQPEKGSDNPKNSNVDRGYYSRKAGEYNPLSEIVLFYDEDFFKQIISDFLRDLQPEFKPWFSLYSKFFYQFHKTLVHELQHAFDDYRSKAKAFQTKKALKHTERYYDQNYNEKEIQDYKEKEKKYKSYLNLPHEIWARFSSALANTKFVKYDIKDDGRMVYEMHPINDTIQSFKLFFNGWGQLSEEMKKRLIKKLTQYWSIKEIEIEEKQKEEDKKYAREELELVKENVEPNIDLTKLKYKARFSGKDSIMFLSPKKLLDRLEKDAPALSVRNKKNQIGNRVEKAKKFIIDYTDDQRWIDPKTGERSKHYTVDFEPSVATINNGKLSFTDGRHRVLAAEELGIDKVAVEVPKNQLDLFKELQEGLNEEMFRKYVRSVLFESGEPDRLSANGEDFNLSDEDAIPFFYYKGKLYVGEETEIHHDILYKKEFQDLIYNNLKSREDGNEEDYIEDLTDVQEEILKETKFNGRLWYDSKFLSFWEFPDKQQMEKIISDLNESEKIKQVGVHIDGSWKIYIDDDRIETIGQYTGGNISDETKEKRAELYKRHMMSPLEKSKLGLNRVPAGWGSKSSDYLGHRTIDRVVGRAE